MRRSILAAGIALGVFMQAASSHAAGPIQRLQVGNWHGGSFTNDQTGAFSHCSALSSYKSGILLMVLVNSSFRWSLRLARPGAQMTPGVSVLVEVTFNGRSQYHVVAFVLTNELVEIPMPEGSALVQTFRHSSQMSVTANGFAAAFDLTQADALFPALTACVRKNLGLPEVATAAAPRPAPVKKPATPAAMPSAPAVAAEPEKPSPPATKAEKSGTGFFVSAEGHVLTNAHVVENCSSIEVPGPMGFKAVQLVAKDETNDLALLKTDLTPSRVALLRTGIKLGEPVAAFGYPWRGLLSSTGNFTVGNVTSLTGVTDDTRYLQISTPIQPGNSGGPLLDSSGNFVGVVSEKLNALRLMVATATEDIPQNVNFAIKSSVAATFLESNSIGFSTGTIGAALEPADLAAQAKAVSLPVLCK
jgi:S1-C subfamily serine protease